MSHHLRGVQPKNIYESGEKLGRVKKPPMFPQLLNPVMQRCASAECFPAMDPVRSYGFPEL